MFVQGGTDDVVPVVTEHLGCRREDLPVDDGTECGGSVRVAEECLDIWMAKQNVGGTFGTGAGDEDSWAAEGTKGVGNESGGSGDVRFCDRVMRCGSITGHIHDMEHIVGKGIGAGHRTVGG